MSELREKLDVIIAEIDALHADFLRAVDYPPEGKRKEGEKYEILTASLLHHWPRFRSALARSEGQAGDVGELVEPTPEMLNKGNEALSLWLNEDLTDRRGTVREVWLVMEQARTALARSAPGWREKVAEIAERANVNSYEMAHDDIAALLTGIRLDLNHLVYEATGALSPVSNSGEGE